MQWAVAQRRGLAACHGGTRRKYVRAGFSAASMPLKVPPRQTADPLT
jgi:hypothetical protein